ncbi:uncharacterized protein LOC107360713 [Tetranychus urticae]|uniref:Uncharacterized protein n=1 Tax=Tetranychus urticae TaxID=32264 RepID=T1K460_TETUR|nr:uncharacterized protein LOC107360713 [Tetranychus urticae]XP_025016234.1 uncharacterized protein LOC107360713 [Tetranychus urticae]
MSSNLVFHILALIFLSINPTSNAFPTFASSFSGSSLGNLFSGVPHISGASVEGTPLVSGASIDGSQLVSNDGLVVDSSNAAQFLPQDFVVPSNVLGSTMLQEVPYTEVIPGYGKVKGFSSKLKSYLPGNPFKGLFKRKESEEDFVIADSIVEAEPKQFKIDPRLIKIASSAVGHLLPVAKSSASAGIGAAVGAPIGAMMGAKAGAVKGAQVGKALAKQKVVISKKIGEVASEFKSRSIAVGKATLNKAVSKITISPTDIKIKEKVTVKVQKPKSLEASVKIQHPIVGDQFGKIKLEAVQPKSTKSA